MSPIKIPPFILNLQHKQFFKSSLTYKYIQFGSGFVTDFIRYILHLFLVRRQLLFCNRFQFWMDCSKSGYIFVDIAQVISIFSDKQNVFAQKNCCKTLQQSSIALYFPFAFPVVSRTTSLVLTYWILGTSFPSITAITVRIRRSPNSP